MNNETESTGNCFFKKNYPNKLLFHCAIGRQEEIYQILCIEIFIDFIIINVNYSYYYCSI